MAEFCIDCLNKISNTHYKEKDFIMSENLEFCDECCDFKHIVITRKKSFKKHGFSFLISNLFK